MEMTLASLPPQIRYENGRFLPGTVPNPGGRPKGFGAYIREQTDGGRELVDFALALVRGKKKAPWRQRLEAFLWLSDHGWGRPAMTVPDLPPGASTLTIREVVLQRMIDDAGLADE